MTDRAEWMIYGANGYTGRLVAVEAKRRGLRPVLAGRRAGPIETLAAELGLPARVFDLGDAQAAAAALAIAASSVVATPPRRFSPASSRSVSTLPTLPTAVAKVALSVSREVAMAVFRSTQRGRGRLSTTCWRSARPPFT